ncbi:MAG TPA: hypothetical protein VHA33_17640 [Candidatus Angelobacter sp.]|nr:hypothetical protein [Candidatus Angelobacter sp.]
MDQIAEEPVSERVVAHILDQASAVGVAMGNPQFFRRCAGIFS